MLQIADVAPDFEGARTPKERAAKDLLQVLASTTACSSRVFYGLLAWASLDAHRPSNAEMTTVPGRWGTDSHS
jgi:hypothetical protein